MIFELIFNIVMVLHDIIDLYENVNNCFFFNYFYLICKKNKSMIMNIQIK